LIPEILQMADEKRTAVRNSSELSSLKAGEQSTLHSLTECDETISFLAQQVKPPPLSAKVVALSADTISYEQDGYVRRPGLDTTSLLTENI